MIENLSVSGRQSNPVTLKLTDDFVHNLSDKELHAVKAKGLWRIDLRGIEGPLTVGRDSFRSVFGEQILGADTIMLSRRHCVFHVSRKSISGGRKPFEVKVELENTSTNGVEVNDKLLRHGERRWLSRGDVVTLLRIPQVCVYSRVCLIARLLTHMHRRKARVGYDTNFNEHDAVEHNMA
ncbi:TPA: hypothetical protein N0F65_001100 [Lagenidium giganteum]|uniref:FHA domain-containing protein n=1 Tax=Lagenidium giganteum TaxID=4803 RepID=A0AAV2YJT0_9STRA|nr:TPA: hypothetical protein N0F65_001100 [Lagenidium giganteum]